MYKVKLHDEDEEVLVEEEVVEQEGNDRRIRQLRSAEVGNDLRE